MENEKKGSCLCKRVTVFLKNSSNEADVCHCSTCRKWNGAPFITIHGGNDDNVIFSGEELITNYSSSELAERGFCKNCGTHLYYRMKETHEYAFPVELFDEMTDVILTKEIYVDQKPGYYSFAENTVKLTKDEFLAQLNEQ